MNVVIVPAGGVGKRVGEQIPKQFISLGGRPLIRHTLAIFEGLPEIDLVVVPVVPTWEGHLREVLCDYGKDLRVVTGGASRQESVARGLEVVPPEAEIVLVHDACRPFASRELVRKVLQMVQEKGAALAALPSRDTVKEIEGEKVLRTLPRERIYLAHTPQGALFKTLQEAFSWARKKGLEFTDEASLLEGFGVSVYVVPSEFKNFKITTREDLELARLLLEQKEETDVRMGNFS